MRIAEVIIDSTMGKLKICFCTNENEKLINSVALAHNKNMIFISMFSTQKKFFFRDAKDLLINYCLTAVCVRNY